MKIIKSTVLIIALTVSVLQAQIYKNDVKKSSITFYSKAPLEDIEGKSMDFTAIVNFANDSIVVRILNTSFKFESSLMEEHFNENYMESAKYKYSTFAGKLSTHIDPSKVGTYTTEADGIVDIHGAKQNKKIGVTVLISDNVKVTSEFSVKLADHNIEIPKIVFQKIAEVVSVKADAVMVKIK
ncbi:MAG: YceI family protein [Cytophagales bacterium]|nr:YceI family protein [Cytophagales bacterium]